MRLLVTGAAGFIGRRVVCAARESGFAVTGTSRLSTVETLAADVTDPSSFEQLRAAGAFDAVVHCAGIAHRSGGISDAEYFRVNTEGTQNMVRFAAEVGARKFILLSSVLVYGRHGTGITENDECHPQDAYASSKLEAENSAIEMGSEVGMVATVLRPSPVIGEGCKGNFARLIRAVDRGRFINIGDGSARKSMIYVGDVADACIKVLRTGNKSPHVFNLAGETVTTGELLRSVYREFGKNCPRMSVPARPLSLMLTCLTKATNVRRFRMAAKNLETWTSDAVYSSESIKDGIGFVAETPMDKAISRTVAAYKAAASN